MAAYKPTTVMWVAAIRMTTTQSRISAAAVGVLLLAVGAFGFFAR